MQAIHKFSAGDRVMVRPSSSNPGVRPGLYTITRVMPESGMGLQYRAKNAMDQHERVLDEAEMQKG